MRGPAFPGHATVTLTRCRTLYCWQLLAHVTYLKKGFVNSPPLPDPLTSPQVLVRDSVPHHHSPRHPHTEPHHQQQHQQLSASPRPPRPSLQLSPSQSPHAPDGQHASPQHASRGARSAHSSPTRTRALSPTCPGQLQGVAPLPVQAAALALLTSLLAFNLEIHSLVMNTKLVKRLVQLCRCVPKGQGAVRQHDVAHEGWSPVVLR